MINRVAVLSAVLLAGMGITIPACARVSNIQILNGTCDSTSHTAEGPLGSDLTKRQSRYYCNSAVITFFDDYTGHVMINFSQNESNHSPILGFAGRIEARQPGDVGTMMQVNSVYLRTGDATAVSEGWCKLFFKDQQLSGIACGMKVDEAGRRTTAVVVFDVAPGQGVSKSNPPPSKPLPSKRLGSTSLSVLNEQGMELVTNVLLGDIKTSVRGGDSLLTAEEALRLTGIDLKATAEQYDADFAANEIAADQKYKGKKILLTGVIESINKDFKGNAQIILKANNPSIVRME
jgi:hypothetical protein